MGDDAMRARSMYTAGLIALVLCVSGCPKKIPQLEIDAAEDALSDLDKTRDCAPETYQAARKTMDRARALLKEERFEEARTALIAARKLAEKAHRECDEKRKRDEAEAAEAARLQREEKEAEPVARPMEVPVEQPTGPQEMVTVYFGFNNSDLTDEARAALASNAEYLRAHEGSRVQVEGHCDERGSTEYNVALGERRALAVKQYLIKMGIKPDGLEIISYGEERAAVPGQTEEAYSRNRRAEFRDLE